MTWIWFSKDDAQVDSYRDFRKTFVCNTADLAQPVMLDISADSVYDVFINGKRIPITQFSDFPEDKTVATIDITSDLRLGINAVAVCVFYIKQRFSTYCPGTPGLYVKIHGATALAETDSSWKTRVDPCYASGQAVMVSSQMCFNSEYDARNDDNWKIANYYDKDWQDAYEQTDVTRNLLPRPTPFLDELPPPSSGLVQYGELKRDGELQTHAITSQNDWLLFDKDAVSYSEKPTVLPVRQTWPATTIVTFNPLRHDGANGNYLVADLGKQTVGYILVAVEAAAGTILDINHGEHLDDGRVRANIAYRNFCDRYICKDGLNVFTHTMRRIGARYLEIHITNAARPVAVHYAGVIPVQLPLPPLGKLDLDDRLFKRTYDIALDTLTYCMHEHYEDCPWREQALYAYDSRNQILYGYYNWGNYEFAAASLNLLGRSYYQNGDIALTAPARWGEGRNLSIPCFTFVWISELYEHYVHSGSIELFKRFQNTVWDIFQKAFARKLEGTGLYRSNDTPHTWNFYEWTDNLANQQEFPQSPYCIYLYEALVSASKMYRTIGMDDKAATLEPAAAALAKALNDTFWDADAKCYSTLLPGKATNNEHVQAVMLYNNIVPVDRQTDTLAALASGKLVPISYSGLPYFVRGLMAGNAETRAMVEPFINNQFDAPILKGATSLWETGEGSDCFDRAGSLCHAWSSIHAFYAKAYLLGVTPLEPGFKRFAVRPYPGRHAYASGQVPTPYGFISVAWTRNGDTIDIEVSHPAEITPVVECYPEYKLGKVTIQ